MLLTVGAAMTAMMLQGPYGGPQNNQQLPRGSYTQSCQNINVDRGRLYAQCADKARRLRQTSIDLGTCRGGEIENIDGQLQCRGGGYNNGGSYGGGGGGNYGGGYSGGYNNGPNRPGGGRPIYNGPPSITVYGDSEFRGQSTTFNGAVSFLGPTGFNDMITSFQVRGRWEVCTDPNFRGECYVYDYDESNVSTNRINDKISSLRPIR